MSKYNTVDMFGTTISTTKNNAIVVDFKREGYKNIWWDYSVEQVNWELLINNEIEIKSRHNTSNKIITLDELSYIDIGIGRRMAFGTIGLMWPLRKLVWIEFTFKNNENIVVLCNNYHSIFNIIKWSKENNVKLNDEFKFGDKLKELGEETFIEYFKSIKDDDINKMDYIDDKYKNVFLNYVVRN